MRNALRLACGSAVVSLLLVASSGQALWAFVARKAAGKVRTMTQREQTGAAGYSVAEVVVNGNAEKAYATALKAIQSSPDARVTHQDPANGDLEFSVRGKVMGLRISQVDSKTVHVLIATTASVGEPDATARAVQATLRICEEMKVTCQQVK